MLEARFWLIKIIIYAMKLFGLAPFSIRTKPSGEKSRGGYKRTLIFSKPGLVYNLLLTILYPLVSIGLILQLRPEKSDNDSFTHYFIAMYRMLRDVASWSIIILWSVRQRNAIHVMNRILEVDSLLSGLKNEPLNKKLLIFSLLHITLGVCAWITVFNIMKFEEVYTAELATFIMPKMIIYVFNIQYIIAVSLLARNFERVNKNLLYIKELKNDSPLRPFLADYPGALNSRPTHKWQLATLQSLRIIRTTLRELSQELGDFFSFPILLVITFYFYSTLRDVSQLLDHFHSVSKSLELSEVLKYTARGIIDVHPFILMLAKISEVLDEAELTKHIVNKLMAVEIDKEIKTELEDFSFQMLNEEIDFTAYGILTLDYKLLHSISGTITSYLIYLYQGVQSD